MPSSIYVIIEELSGILSTALYMRQGVSSHPNIRWLTAISTARLKVRRWVWREAWPRQASPVGRRDLRERIKGVIVLESWTSWRWCGRRLSAEVSALSLSEVEYLAELILVLLSGLTGDRKIWKLSPKGFRLEFAWSAGQYWHLMSYVNKQCILDYRC